MSAEAPKNNGFAMQRIGYALLLCTPIALVAGCAGGPSPLPSLTTGSLLGSKPPAPPVAPANTPVNRAFQLGAVSARATKCGFNFDAERLKANFFAGETQQGTAVDDLAKAEKVYKIAYNGVAKAANRKEDYCSEKRTGEIKTDLNRLLTGDFSPQPPRPREEEADNSIFSFGNGTTLANNPLE